MLKKLKDLIYGRDLTEYLKETKTIRIKGFNFTIKRVNTLKHFLPALNATRDIDQSPEAYEKHMKDVVLDGVIYPKLHGPGELGSIDIELFLQDTLLFTLVYRAIAEFTLSVSLKPYLKLVK